MKGWTFRRALSQALLACLVLLLMPSLGVAASVQQRQEALAPLFDGPCAKYGVPKALVLAIARQESGLYPWIINISGHDVRPRSKGDALRYAQWAMNAGRSFDVGIMQINSYWIKKYGWSLEQVLEPANNVKIGVWILAQEIRRHGLTWRAVAYYHTPLHKNPERGRRYAAAIMGHLRKIMAKG